MQKLTNESLILHYSVFNMLSSGLAIFLMKCLPDIWSSPFLDLANLWSSQQGLLLRFLNILLNFFNPKHFLEFW